MAMTTKVKELYGVVLDGFISKGDASKFQEIYDRHYPCFCAAETWNLKDVPLLTTDKADAKIQDNIQQLALWAANATNTSRVATALKPVLAFDPVAQAKVEQIETDNKNVVTKLEPLNLMLAIHALVPIFALPPTKTFSAELKAGLDYCVGLKVQPKKLGAHLSNLITMQKQSSTCSKDSRSQSGASCAPVVVASSAPASSAQSSVSTAYPLVKRRRLA